MNHYPRRNKIDTVFKKIKPQKVTKEIADQIRSLIKEGQLQPGEKLPPERSFSEMLGVGRSSLREAINILETQGFVETRKRQGVYIRSLGSPLITDPLRQILEEDKHKLLHLYEVRKDIELASAFMAAKHCTSKDLSHMKKLLEQMENDAQKDDLKLQNDLGFHMAIAQSSKNVFRSHILKSIFELSSEYLHFITKILIKKSSGMTQQLFEQHNDIYEAIELKNQEKARTMMEAHLNWVEEKWKRFIIDKELG